MIDSTAARPAPARTSPPPRWPYQGRPQRRLLAAALLVLIGAVTPWVDTVAGNVLGITGGGMYTLAAGGIGLAGSFFRRRGIVAAHAVVLAVVPLVIGGWQLFRLIALGCDFRVCAPSFGLLLTMAGGALAAAATGQLLRGAPRTS